MFPLKKTTTTTTNTRRCASSVNKARKAASSSLQYNRKQLFRDLLCGHDDAPESRLSEETLNLLVKNPKCEGGKIVGVGKKRGFERGGGVRDGDTVPWYLINNE